MPLHSCLRAETRERQSRDLVKTTEEVLRERRNSLVTCLKNTMMIENLFERIQEL